MYLEDEEAEQLRQMAATTGKSQAALIREAVRQALRQTPKRRFHSAGIGEGSGDPAERHWTADELYRKVFLNR
jgi:predicted transcriptional regulator